jgi:hypothetical protein
MCIGLNLSRNESDGYIVTRQDGEVRMAAQVMLINLNLTDAELDPGGQTFEIFYMCKFSTCVNFLHV